MTDIYINHDAEVEISPNALTAQGNNFNLALEGESLEWNSKQIRAAMCFAGILLPPSKTSSIDVAEACELTLLQIKKLRAHPDFQNRIDELVTHTQEEIMTAGMSLKARRIIEKQKRHGLLNEIIEKRQEWAAQFAQNDSVDILDRNNNPLDTFVIPGVHTGMMILRRRSIGSGPFQQQIIEGEIDVALMNEISRLEKDIAIELGQLNPNQSVSINMKLYGNVDISNV